MCFVAHKLLQKFTWNLCEIIPHARCNVIIENLAKQNKALLIIAQDVLQGARLELKSPDISGISFLLAFREQ